MPTNAYVPKAFTVVWLTIPLLLLYTKSVALERLLLVIFTVRFCVALKTRAL